jgi:hypothetical protein
MEDTFHVYLSSEDSIATFPTNSAEDFSCLLADRLQLHNEVWQCGLVEFRLTERPAQPTYLCSNICEDSIVGGYKLPVLCRVDNKNTQPSHVIYLRVKTSEVSVIRLYLENSSGRSEPLTNATAYCTLRFRKHENIRDSPRC